MRRFAVRAAQALLCASLSLAVFLQPAKQLARADEPIRVYVFAGQSNMVGAGAVASDLPLIAPRSAEPFTEVLFWGPVADFPIAWGPLKAPTEILQPRRHQGFGPELAAAPILAGKHPDSTVAVVKYAVSGTTLYRDWDPARPGSLYRRMIERVRTAVSDLRATRPAPVEISGFFWMQGESDSERAGSAFAYRSNLTRFIRAVRRDLTAPKLPFVIGRISDLRHAGNTRFQYSDVVRKGQDAAASSIPGAYVVSTDGLERATDSPIHFSSRGTLDLGRRFVEPSLPL